MPRIRSLKPEFWTDSKVVRLGPYARLLFQGLWNHADEWGVVKDDPAQLKLQILPSDDVDCAALVAQIVDVGLIRRARTNADMCVLVIPKFRDHQKVDTRLQPKFGDPATFSYDTSNIGHPEKSIQPDSDTNPDMSAHVATNPDMSDGVRGQGSGFSPLPPNAGSDMSGRHVGDPDPTPELEPPPGDSTPTPEVEETIDLITRKLGPNAKRLTSAGQHKKRQLQQALAEALTAGWTPSRLANALTVQALDNAQSVPAVLKDRCEHIGPPPARTAPGLRNAIVDCPDCDGLGLVTANTGRDLQADTPDNGAMTPCRCRLPAVLKAVP